jgi:hypothetical protein
MSKNPNGKRLNLENGVMFQGFDSLYDCFALKFKQKQRKQLMTLRNRLNHFRARFERSASKINAKKLQNLRQMTIHNMFNY